MLSAKLKIILMQLLMHQMKFHPNIEKSYFVKCVKTHPEHKFNNSSFELFAKINYYTFVSFYLVKGS